MKLTAQEEYGLRCLLQIGRLGDGASLTIPEISRAEGLSIDYVAKLMRILRRGGFVKSIRGSAGGYTLARPADKINVGEVLAVLGGRIFEPSFCDRHAGIGSLCTHSIDCSVRSLWRAVQTAVDQLLSRITLKDLLCSEPEMVSLVTDLVTTSSAETRLRN
jgi:Rrf2 family protein